MVKVYYFSAEWCEPCQIYGPLVDRVVPEFALVDLQKMNIDEPAHQMVAMKYKLKSVPTLTVEDNKIPPLVGAVEESTLRAWLTAATRRSD